MTRVEKRLLRIAHHEAGHAVMAVWQGMPFDAVSIEPNVRNRGEVTGYRQTDLAECPMCNAQTWNETKLLMVLAGPVAERMFSSVRRSAQIGRDCLFGFYGVNTDYWRAYYLSKVLHRYDLRPRGPQLTHSQAMTVESHLKYMEARVTWIFEDCDGAGWKAVDALAAALLSRKVLNHEDALSIISPVLFPGVEGKAA